MASALIKYTQFNYLFVSYIKKNLKNISLLFLDPALSDPSHPLGRSV